MHVQGAFLFQDAANAGNNLIRMDVRVVWPRGISGYAVGPCDPAVAAAVVPNPTLYHSIYMTTAFRQNSLQ